MTSAKFSDFLTPSPPCHCHKSADFVPYICFLGTHLPQPTADVIYVSPLMPNIDLSIRTWIIVERARRAEGFFSGELAVGDGGGERVVVCDGISRGGVQVREGIQQEQDEDLEKEEREGALIILQCC